MSDNPYERDNPDDPVGPTPPTDGVQPARADDGAPSSDTSPATPEPLTTTDADTSVASPADEARTQPLPATADEPEAGSATHDDGAAADDAPTARDDTPSWVRDDTRATPVAATEASRYDPSAPPSVETPDADDAPTARDAADSSAAGRLGTEDPDGAVTSTFDVREAERTRPSGSHEAERPVPRSGLAEHRSAGYLTGERLPLTQDADLAGSDRSDSDSAQTSASWLSGGAAAAGGATAAGAAATRPAEEDEDRATPSTTADRPRAERDVLLDGTTAVTRPPSRAGAHVLTVLLTLLLTPVAWYLLADAGARLTLPRGNPWETGNLNVAALLELGGGLLVLVVVLLAARWSSLGAIVTGSLVLIVGVPFVAVPTWTQEILEPVAEWLDGLGDFGANVAHHLVASGSTGRLVVYGLALILVGVVSHGARRKGRREVRPVVEAG